MGRATRDRKPLNDALTTAITLTDATPAMTNSTIISQLRPLSSSFGKWSDLAAGPFAFSLYPAPRQIARR
jgi:hypothetical protein